MKNLLFILFIVLSSCTYNSGSNKKEVNNSPSVVIGKDYVAADKIAYVFRDLFSMSEASKALNADDQDGFRLIVFDSDKTMLIEDSIPLRVYEVNKEYSEVRITDGIYENEKGYVFNKQLKIKE